MINRDQNHIELQSESIDKIRVGCPAHNCGGRCLLIAHIQDGSIIRLETDDRPDKLESPQLRACVRGRAYLRRQYHPDRLLHPLKRTGKRGAGEFKRIRWVEAIELAANQMERIKNQYGNSALFIPYGTGSYNQINGSQIARRLMNLYGGCLGTYNSYSWGAINAATPTVFGTLKTGNQRQDWLNSKYILMWGWNPAEMRDGTNSDYFIKLARQNGAQVVCIDPRHSLSAACLADEWIPIRPGTDTAMMTAMAYTMVTEDLFDAPFVQDHCVGFDQEHMPPGLKRLESYEDYLLGKFDGQPKTTEWAEAITSVPAETIRRIARDYATKKPGILYQGYGMQRRAFGEQVVRAGCVLAALTGNIGVPGGWASGLGLPEPQGGSHWNIFPTGINPVNASIPVFLWTDAAVRGRKMTSEDGVIGAEKLDNNIKMIYSAASNILINQHADTNKNARILKDEKLVEYIIVQDNFLTPSATYADLILPACTQFETWGVEDGWKFSDEIILQPKLVEPPGECLSDYEICSRIAEKLGFKNDFTEGRDERDWVEWCLDHYRNHGFPNLPTLDEFLERNIGVYSNPVNEGKVALQEFREDPIKHPLDTPSGLIEIFSKQLYEIGDPEKMPPIPKYIQEWDHPFGNSETSSALDYPLQAIGHHTLHRVHSTHDNNDWLSEAFPQRVFINPIDASSRDILDGEKVLVFNKYGKLCLPCRITKRIMPGVINIPEGAWWAPDENDVDQGGNINVLTSHQWTPFAFGSTQHTIMVQISKFNSIQRNLGDPR
ncbi:DMSO/selenate family reductase complex A subunit [Chloroflexota bacterium]